MPPLPTQSHPTPSSPPRPPLATYLLVPEQHPPVLVTCSTQVVGGSLEGITEQHALVAVSTQPGGGGVRGRGGL